MREIVENLLLSGVMTYIFYYFFIYKSPEQKYWDKKKEEMKRFNLWPYND